jgi:hypothetical protein
LLPMTTTRVCAIPETGICHCCSIAMLVIVEI